MAADMKVRGEGNTTRPQQARKASAQQEPEKEARLGCVPPRVLSARRIERAIVYAEKGYYLFFLVTVPLLLWR